MTRIPYDQASKQLLVGALEGVARVELQHEVKSEPQWVDAWIEPIAGRSRLPGLLGRMVTEPCGVEVFYGAVGLADAIACLGEQLAIHARRRRSSRRGARVPRFWLVSSGRPMGVLDGLGFQRLRGWPSGVYRLPNLALPLRLVVAGELPRTRATLLVRALGTGRVLREALTDLASLPNDAWERTAAVAALHVLRSKSPPADEVDDPDERAIIMTNAELYERIKSEGRVEAKARAVLNVLAARGIAVSEAQEERIVRCTDEATLDRWLLAAIAASSAEDVLRA